MSDKIYKNIDSLKPVQLLNEEAGKALDDSSRTIATSSMPAVLAAALGSGIGAAGSFAALYFLGTVGLGVAGITSGLATAGALVGGGMVCGLGVLVAPVAGLGILGYAIFAGKAKRRLIQAKEALLKAIVAKHDAILREINNHVSRTDERANYLQALNISLTRAINDLRQDIDK